MLDCSAVVVVTGERGARARRVDADDAAAPLKARVAASAARSRCSCPTRVGDGSLLVLVARDEARLSAVCDEINQR